MNAVVQAALDSRKGTFSNFYETGILIINNEIANSTDKNLSNYQKSTKS